MEQPAASPSTLRRGAVRWLWFLAGWAAVVVGAIGIVLPVLPSTVFFIGAASCFAKSSPRFERWVLNLPRVGPLVRDYRAGLGMGRRAKAWAVGMMLAVVTASAVFAVGEMLMGGAVIALGMIGAAYVIYRVPTRERVLADLADRIEPT